MKQLTVPAISRCAPYFALASVCACFLISSILWAQQLSKRLFLKDGSYQLVLKWEANGERVRYLSAERGEWEELPNELIDWAATDKFEKNRANGAPAPEAVQLDKEAAEERAADLAKTPEVAPDLHLPEDGSVLLLDTFQNQAQLVELQQDTGEINRNTKANLLRAAINPLSGTRQTIELDGSHATVQAHVSLPSIYVNLAQHDAVGNGADQPQQPEKAQGPLQEWDRFHIVRVQVKKDNRVIGAIRINPLGKVNQQESLKATTAEKLMGGWVKITPSGPLDPGEYAIVEILGRQGMNLYVWDFGVNPNAPANALAIKPAEKGPEPTSKQLEPVKPRPSN